jgi:hypothetical protein
LTIDELRLLIFDLSCRQILPLPFKNPQSKIVTRQSIPLPLKVTQAMDEKGEHRCFQYKGKDMPGRFWPGQSLLTRFDLTWDGKRIPIAERFWNDLTRARPSRPRPFGARQPQSDLLTRIRPTASRPSGTSLRSCPSRLQAFAVFHQLARHNAATTGHPSSSSLKTEY